MRRAGVLVLGAVSASAYACSGPHVQETMLRMVGIGWIGFGIVAIFSIVMNSWYRQVKAGPGHPIAIVALLAAHPSWWVSAYGGDCGGGLFDLTVLMALFVLGLLLWQRSFLYKEAALITSPTEADEQGFAPYPRHSDR